MHPIDVKARDQETPTPGGRSGWWVLFALVLIVALAVVFVIGLSEGTETPPQENIPNEAPVEPGLPG